MSSPKLYLIIIHNNLVDHITTFRELDSAQNEWTTLETTHKVGVLHCGFVRPSIPEKLELPELVNGKIIYSAALKWMLPEYFKSSKKPIVDIVLNEQSTPCYLALNQWGYEELDKQELEGEVLSHNLSPINIESIKDTISLAAQQVLKDVNNLPLNKYEIYARIIDSDYYQFNTPKPVHVLDVTLNRESIGTNYSKAAKNPVFAKSKQGQYYLLGDKAEESKGWVCSLMTNDPGLYQKLHEYGVSDDDGYLAIRNQLPDQTSMEIDNIRFDLLRATIDQNDPCKLLRIAPQWLLDLNISDLGFTVRVTNVVLHEGMSTVSELAELTVNELMRLPNMGKRSISDMCDAIVNKIKRVAHDLGKAQSTDTLSIDISDQETSEMELIPLGDQIAQLPLRHHLNRTLDGLSDAKRLVLHGRLGYKGKELTLGEVAKKLDVSRQRVLQLQNICIKNIVAEEYWDDVIGVRIGQLLLDREEPLVLEMLEIEDPWFQGFMDDSYTYLANVVQMFSENAIHVIDAEGRNVITRIRQKDWDALVRDIKKILKQKAAEKIWSRSDVEQYCESCLSEHSSKELMPLLLESVSDFLQYESASMDAILVAYGKTAESAIYTVLVKAEGPLHFTEIARLASELLGKHVDDRRAHSAAASNEEVWLYDRGIYGLIDHCPLPESKRKSIRQMVEQLISQGEINKQWHSKEIIESLKEKYLDIPDELEPYVLRMCIEGSDKIKFLNRMVWARADSGLNVTDRIMVTDAFIQILEETGKPLSGQELKDRLSEIRGVDENMQIHPNERLVVVGPNIWGLSEWSKERT